MKKHNRTNTTSASVQPGDCAGVPPEFLRTNDVRRIYGIPRGSLYGLAKLGKIKGCLLRIRGAKSGLRLWSADSIRACISEQMDAGKDAQ
jgi:hypothetical protein